MPEGDRQLSKQFLALKLRRPLAEKLNSAIEHLKQENHSSYERLAAYGSAIETAQTEGRSADAANLAWEAAHCWLHAD